MSLGTPKFQGKKARNRGNFLTKKGSMVGRLTKGVYSLEESQESPKSQNSLEDGRLLLYFPQSGSSLESLNS